MKLRFAAEAKTEIAAFIVDEGARLPAAAEALDEACGGLLSEAATSGRFSGKAGQKAVIVLPKGSAAKRAVLMGGGKTKDRNARAYEPVSYTHLTLPTILLV